MVYNLKGADMGYYSALESLFQDALQSALGGGFRVNAGGPEGSPRKASSGPDYVVWPKDPSCRPLMVELQLMDKDFDLPLSVASQTRRILDEHRSLHPILIVATTGRVGNLLRQEFWAQDVELVRNPLPEKLVGNLSTFILERYEAPASLTRTS
jgi:hypothetical protein